MQSLNRDLAWRGPGSDQVTRRGSTRLAETPNPHVWLCSRFNVELAYQRRFRLSWRFVHPASWESNSAGVLRF
jgi:hypothetical protein